MAGSKGYDSVVLTLVAAGSHISPTEWEHMRDIDNVKTGLFAPLARRFAEELPTAPGVKSMLIGDDGMLTPNGFDYAYGGVLPKMFNPVHWKGNEVAGLEFYELLVNAIPDELKDDIVPGLDLTELRRSAAKSETKTSAVTRYKRSKTSLSNARV